MIDTALRLLAGDINGWFRRRRVLGNNGGSPAGSSLVFPLDPVVVSSLVDADGSVPIETDDKIVLVLTRIAEERNIGGSRGGVLRQGDGFYAQTAPIFLELQVLLAARFRRYEAGLGVLSEVIAYLRTKPVMTHQNTPGMGEDLERLELTMLKLDYSEEYHLWSALGAKYSPSAVYSLRLLPLGRAEVRETLPVIQEASVNELSSSAE